MVPYSKVPFSAVDSKDNRKLSLKAAREGIVLLKNAGNILPLDRNKYKTIAVIGPNANETEVLYGNYSGTPSKAVSVLEGIKAKAGSDKNINYAKGCELVVPQISNIPIPTANLKGRLKAEFFGNMKLEEAFTDKNG